jgi:hypothetical protein
MSKELVCPFCNKKLEPIGTSGQFQCGTWGCDASFNFIATRDVWEYIARTRKALDYAIDVIQTVAKMSDKLSREYGETLVEQLDNIQAYCWQEGYVLTHEEDLSKALEQKDVK